MIKIKITAERQRKKVEKILGDHQIISWEDYGVCVDGFISFDKMAEIADYLRKSVDKNKDLFEQCWVAYRRKGVKNKALGYWNKLEESEMMMVMAHIKAYVSSRDVQYQKDFERYLRDRVFMEVVYNGNNIIYDPTKTSSEEPSLDEKEGSLIINGQEYR